MTDSQIKAIRAGAYMAGLSVERNSNGVTIYHDVGTLENAAVFCPTYAAAISEIDRHL